MSIADKISEARLKWIEGVRDVFTEMRDIETQDGVIEIPLEDWEKLKTAICKPVQIGVQN